MWCSRDPLSARIAGAPVYDLSGSARIATARTPGRPPDVAGALQGGEVLGDRRGTSDPGQLAELAQCRGISALPLVVGEGRKDLSLTPGDAARMCRVAGAMATSI